jgi:hypothetical protein
MQRREDQQTQLLIFPAFEDGIINRKEQSVDHSTSRCEKERKKNNEGRAT